MADFDPNMMKEMAKLKDTDDADRLINTIKNSQSNETRVEFKAPDEVEQLKRQIEKQNYLIHAFWLLLKEKGATNEEFNKVLNEAVLLGKRTDYKNITICPNCGKGLQAMENRPFTSKCYYCGGELIVNPYQKFDELDPYDVGYADKIEEPAPYVSDEEADAQEIQDAADVISQSFEPYDVTQDLNFDDENI